MQITKEQSDKIKFEARRARFEKESRARKIEIFGPRYDGAVLSGITFQEEISAKILDFLSRREYFLVMTGNSGTSKTYFCAAVYQHLHDEAYGSCVYPDVRYFREIDVYDNVKKSFDTENGSQSEKIRNLIDHQFLIIDDVASQSPTDWQKSMFFDLVDLRYKSGKPTIFTSNLTYSQFHQIYDQRTCSRLFAAENTIVDVSGDDLRKQGM